MIDLDTRVDAFIRRWSAALISEDAHCQSFVAQLCDILGVDAPDSRAAGDLDYAFQRPVMFRHDDGSQTRGRIDCYKRGCFVLEAKQSEKRRPGREMAPVEARPGKVGGAASRLDDAMGRALRQARGYAHALDEWPPFLVLMDIGRSIELWADFSGLGKAYAPFPSHADHRIALSDLTDPEVRERLRRVWRDPGSLDPSRRRAEVTTGIGVDLARLITSLEGGRRTEHEGAEGTRARHVALYVLQCTFAMFAQDIGALPDRAFDRYLEIYRTRPDRFHHGTETLFGLMHLGGFCDTIQADIRRFNGGLFRERPTVRLQQADLDLLAEIAGREWRNVEPAIFGSLLEQALSPQERQRLGAHFTPREYVERLVLPTIIDPLRAEWEAVLGGASDAAAKGRVGQAQALVLGFHRRLCTVRVLDPACGTGNFLYVAMGALQDLEEEVLSRLAAFGYGQSALELQGHTISPEQFWGLEINPVSVWIAEMMLWVGYLQRQYLRYGRIGLSDPILQAFGTIRRQDALIACSREVLRLNGAGEVLQEWDGVSRTTHPVTGEEIPDLARQRPVKTLIDPRQAEWPDVHFIVGNPPFISANNVRRLLGEGYQDALRAAYDPVLSGADLALYWWARAAAELTRPGASLRRFGFITSNSIVQKQSRKLLEQRLRGRGAVSLTFAIADHPWRSDPDGAAVRIAMTVAEAGEGRVGRLLALGEDGRLLERLGVIGPQLSLQQAAPASLRDNRGLAFRGVCVGGPGFWLPREAAERFRQDPEAAALTRRIVNGRDLTARDREAWVIDAYGLSEAELRVRAPDLHQWLLLRVKPHRDASARASYRDRWWIFAEPRPEMRAALAGLSRQIVTPMTAKHRVFQFLPTDRLPDQGLISVAREDAFALGVLSSRAHLVWARAHGGTLEDRPRYNHSLCFETFPWPACDLAQRRAIGDLAEELDTRRREALGGRADLTLTGLYNLIEKAAGAGTLSATEREVFEQARLGLINRLHGQLDAQVTAAYGWPAEIGREQVLMRLQQLNAERARRDDGARGSHSELPELALTLAETPRPVPDDPSLLAAALLRTLRETGAPQAEVGLAKRFNGAGVRRKVEYALGGLSAAGVAGRTPDGRWYALDRAA